MNYWIFTAVPHKSDTESYSAREIYETRMRDRFWGLGERTPNRRNIRSGDAVVFYVGRPECVFAGTAELASDCFVPSDEERSALSHGSAFFVPQFGVRLNSIEAWATPHSVAELAPDLDFIENPTQWGTYLQGGIRQISEEDFQRILTGPTAHTPARRTEEISSQGMFALEAHLEEFIAHNWNKIAWGARLELYRDGDQTGRQYPAGTWSIDFLAVDRLANELVVIELKRGQTSDATIGQILRYLTWTRENIAVPGQNVRGIIVASAVDDALRYAAKGLPNVSIVTYSVNFILNAVTL